MSKARAVRPELLTLLVSLAFLLFYNLPLWQRLLAITPAGWQGLGMMLAVGLMIAAIFNLALTLLAFRWLLKPALTLLILAAAGTTYFMTQYGVLMDVGMLRNVMQTNPAEVADLLSPKLAVYLALLGALPVWLLWRTPVRYRPWPRELLSKLLVALACLALLAGVALANYQGLSSLFRNNKELRLQVTPSNLVGAAIGYAKGQAQAASQPLRPIAVDARRADLWQGHARKSLTVLVVGESARAQNFGLNGYARETNPRLKAEEGLINFSNVHSCGTETAVSVPCMFSNLGRADYSDARARTQEGLLDVLQRAGLRVLWRDNQSGCKGTCDRVAFQDLSESKDPALCAGGECHDEILLRDLQAFIDGLQQDTVLVLHQMGSHGPAYFKRYPREYEKFTPVCASNDFSACSRDSIINGYDNTLLYTDHVLASLIDLLRKNEERIDTGCSTSPTMASRSASTTSTCMARLTCWRRTSRSTSACWPGSRPATRAPSASTVAACASAATRSCPRTTCSTRCSACWKCAPAPTIPASTCSPRAVRPRSCRRSRPTADGRCTPRKRLARSRRLPDTTRRKDYFLRLAEG